MLCDSSQLLCRRSESAGQVSHTVWWHYREGLLSPSIPPSEAEGITSDACSVSGLHHFYMASYSAPFASNAYHRCAAVSHTALADCCPKATDITSFSQDVSVFHPAYCHLRLRASPQMPAASVNFTTFTWPAILRQLRQMHITGALLSDTQHSLAVAQK